MPLSNEGKSLRLGSQTRCEVGNQIPRSPLLFTFGLFVQIEGTSNLWIPEGAFRKHSLNAGMFPDILDEGLGKRLQFKPARSTKIS